MSEYKLPRPEEIEPELEKHYQDMRAYFERIKCLPHDEAVKEAKQSLFDSGIIDVEGNLTDTYGDIKKI